MRGALPIQVGHAQLLVCSAGRFPNEQKNHKQNAPTNNPAINFVYGIHWDPPDLGPLSVVIFDHQIGFVNHFMQVRVS